MLLQRNEPYLIQDRISRESTHFFYLFKAYRFSKDGLRLLMIKIKIKCSCRLIEFKCRQYAIYILECSRYLWRTGSSRHISLIPGSGAPCLVTSGDQWPHSSIYQPSSTAASLKHSLQWQRLLLHYNMKIIISLLYPFLCKQTLPYEMSMLKVSKLTFLYVHICVLSAENTKHKAYFLCISTQ